MIDSSKFKDLLSTLNTYLTISAVAISLFFISNQSKIIENFPVVKDNEWLQILLKVIALILFLSPLLIYLYQSLKLTYIIKKGRLNSHIIEKQEVFVDIFHPNGKCANIHQKVFFHRVSSKNKRPYITKLNFSGRIIPNSIKSLNCSYSLPKEGEIRINYINNISNISRNSNYLFRENDKFLMFYFQVKDSFTEEEENWTMKVKNLCQEYTVEILLPKGRRVKSLDFLRENNEKVKDIEPIVISQGNRRKIILKVMNFTNNEDFKLVWSLK